jgi:type I restriction enzyme, R subunit
MKVSSFFEFARELLDIQDLPNYEVLVQRGFSQFMAAHQFSADQIGFLRAVENVFLRKRQLEPADLYEGPLLRFGQGAVDRLFTNDEVRELMAFAQEISA